MIGGILESFVKENKFWNVILILIRYYFFNFIVKNMLVGVFNSFKFFLGFLVFFGYMLGFELIIS